MAQDSPGLLNEAFALYLQKKATTEQQAARREIVRFIRWCGRNREIQSLTPLEVEGYCGTLEGVGEDSTQRVALLKGFLGYLHRSGWTETNLAAHAKLRRSGKKTPTARRRGSANASRLTADGYQQLHEELAALKAQRAPIVDEIRRAAATKDFSENAPLDAAREHQSQTESRIRELEGILKGATILEEELGNRNSQLTVTVGSTVVLRQAQTGQEVSYLLVESREGNPSAGKLSAASPLGKAVLDRAIGDEVEVVTPRGAVRYLVSQIGG